MTRQLLIAGAGMAGTAAAIAAARAGWEPRLFEQAAVFSEAGAGIQLGPNATRLLRAWGLERPLAEAASFPQSLRIFDAASGLLLAGRELGAACRSRYGAPYATLHRADLHALLLSGARAAGAEVRLSTAIGDVRQVDEAVVLRSGGFETEGDALVGADGLWSRVRALVAGDVPPRRTGHLAFRALLRPADLPFGPYSRDVTVWLGPRLHAVAYPVRQGSGLNLVVIVHACPQDLTHDRGWDHEAAGLDLHRRLGATCAPLRDMVAAASSWRLWALHDRPAVASADEMASGRVALMGDAAHPMRPYLAQGAAMALEDADALGAALALVQDKVVDVPTALRRYALSRWQRCAQVQRRSVRNGQVFHATGPLRWGRNLALRLAGDRLLDQPWLYG